MNPTVETFMAKLAQNPSEAIAFDNCRPDLTRRQHCQLVLSKVQASCSTIAASKKLADARAANARLKAEVAIAKNRLKFLTPEATVRHNLHAAPGFKKAVGPAKPTRAIAPAAKVSAAPAKPATSAAKSCLGNTNLSKVSAFFAAQARK